MHDHCVILVIFLVKIMCFQKILPHDVTWHHFGTTSLFKISMLCAQDLEFVISDKHTLLHDFDQVPRGATLQMFQLSKKKRRLSCAARGEAKNEVITIATVVIALKNY